MIRKLTNCNRMKKKKKKNEYQVILKNIDGGNDETDQVKLNDSDEKHTVGNRSLQNVIFDNTQDDESFISQNLTNTPAEEFILNQVFH